MSAETPRRPRRYSPFVPMLLTLLVLLAMLGVRNLQLLGDRDRLREQRAELVEARRQTDQAKQQLEAIGTGLARLAARGNVNAQEMIQRLARRGIVLEPEDEASRKLGAEGDEP
jgi:hypothetical protein